MPRTTYLILLVCFFIFSGILPAQSRFSIDLGAGTGLYFGELQTFHLDPSAGFRTRFHLNDRMAIAYSFDFTYLHAKDAWSTDHMRKWYRNLSFRSIVLSNSLSFQYFPFPLKWKIKPYLNAGAGIFYMKPEAKLGGVWYDLRDSGTEGQYYVGCPICPEAASRLQVQLPVGVGAEWMISNKWFTGFEIKHHFTLTDYLDDVGSDFYLDFEHHRLATGHIRYMFHRRGNPLLENQDWEESGRGNPKTKDSWMQLRVYIGVLLGK